VADILHRSGEKSVTGRRITVRDFPRFGSGRQQQPGGVRVLPDFCNAAQGWIPLTNPFGSLLTDLPNPGGGTYGKYYSLTKLKDPRVNILPYSIRYLLEFAVPNCDNFRFSRQMWKKSWIGK
jgi:hypothetical protein